MFTMAYYLAKAPVLSVLRKVTEDSRSPSCPSPRGAHTDPQSVRPYPGWMSVQHRAARGQAHPTKAALTTPALLSLETSARTRHSAHLVHLQGRHSHFEKNVRLYISWSSPSSIGSPCV